MGNVAASGSNDSKNSYRSLNHQQNLGRKCYRKNKKQKQRYRLIGRLRRKSCDQSENARRSPKNCSSKVRREGQGHCKLHQSSDCPAKKVKFEKASCSQALLNRPSEEIETQ